MNDLKLAFRNVFSWKMGQLGKIIFLGTGLAAGLMLLTKVWFEYSFEDFYPDTDRINVLFFSVEENGEKSTVGATSGGLAPWFKERIPMIEAATRVTPLSWGDKDVFFTGDRQKLSGVVYLADSCLFDILPRAMIVGDAKETLGRPMYALISESLANSINGNPVGQTIEFNNYPGKIFTIGGVFEDVAENTLYRYDMLVSLSSINAFMWDGSERINGNERYHSFVKLYPGTDIGEFNEALKKEYSQTEIYKLLQSWGVELQVYSVPVTDVHKNDPDARRMTLVLLILAVSIIFATVFNYLLVVLSDTFSRGREIAVMKCHGAGFRDIARRVLSETLLQLILLVIAAGFLVFLFKNTTEQVLGTSVAGLLTWHSGLLIGGVMVVILLLSTYVQARVYNNIPVASVFRSYKGTGRRVKLSLLFVQILVASFLALLLVTVIRQYNTMLNDDHGYTYDDMLVASLFGVEKSRIDVAVWELNQLDVVEGVALASDLPHEGAGGNNVMFPEERKDLFNIADLEYVDENFVPLMGIKIIEGSNFGKSTREGDYIVSRSFAERMKEFADWDDGIVGKSLLVSAHPEGISIVGVYEDFRIGVIGDEDRRPSALFYSSEEPYTVIIKMRELGSESIRKVTETLQSMFPDRDVPVTVYADLILNGYQTHMLFRKAITIAAIIVMVIVFVGLIGYARDETSRREKEIAIRKINGATVGTILRIMSRDIVKIMLPAMIIGIAVANYLAGKWMEEFSVKAPMYWWIALVCAIVLAIVAITSVMLSALHIAQKNPAESIKAE